MVRKIEILAQNEFWEGLGFQGAEIKLIVEALEIAIGYYEQHRMPLKANAARDLLQHIYAPPLIKKAPI